MILTEAKIVEQVFEGRGLSSKGAIQTTAAVMGIIKRTLESGEDVLITNFGKFQVKEKPQGKASGTLLWVRS